MPKPSPNKDPEQLKLKLLGLEASAIGRYPVNCVVGIGVLWIVLAVVWMIGRGFGLW